MTQKGPHVLIIGAGLTGASLAHYCAQVAAPLQLTVWERSQGPGGRFSTIRSSRSPAIIDHGAQYITRGAGRDPDLALYETLLSDGVIQPYTGMISGGKPGHEAQEHFICRDGMSSVAGHMLGRTAVEYDRCAFDVQERDGRWLVKDSHGGSETFDAIVVTAPTPQLLELEGADLRALLAPHADALARVAKRYSTRFAACVWYGTEAWEALAEVPWASKYVRSGENGNEGLVYMSIEPRKREQTADSPPALLLHSSVPFGLAHLEDDDDTVLRMLLADLAKLLPTLPPPAAAELHRWKYSQAPPPHAVLRGETGEVAGAEDGALLLRRGAGDSGGNGGGAATAAIGPPLVVAGDGLTGSNFDSAVASGRAASAKLLAALASATS